MNFKDWWEESIKNNPYLTLDDKDASKQAWLAAVEQAAKLAREYGQDDLADMLKEQL